MDSMITAAARALAAGDAFGALNRVALRDDPPALALRGIAMAQIGDLARARVLLQRAARAFGPGEAVARARCVVAEAETALVSRELGGLAKRLDSARATLAASGDQANAAHAGILQARRLLLLGDTDGVGRILAAIDASMLPPVLRIGYELVAAGTAIRRVHANEARTACARAKVAARKAGIPALAAEVENVERVLDAPAAHLVAGGDDRLLSLDEVEALLASHALVVDACRYSVRQRGHAVTLATRPVLFELVRMLAEAWPDEVRREQLILRAFRLKADDPSHRARLRVEIGRLRQSLDKLAGVKATARGYLLVPRDASRVAVLAQPLESRHGDVLALLADGEAWSSSALALVLGSSQRSVQRALEHLAGEDKVQSSGHGRARRWVGRSVPGFPTTLLLPAPLPGD